MNEHSLLLQIPEGECIQLKWDGKLEDLTRARILDVLVPESAKSCPHFEDPIGWEFWQSTGIQIDDVYYYFPNFIPPFFDEKEWRAKLQIGELTITIGEDDGFFKRILDNET